MLLANCALQLSACPMSRDGNRKAMKLMSESDNRDRLSERVGPGVLNGIGSYHTG